MTFSVSDKARVVACTNPRHGFEPGTLVTILGQPTGKPGVVYVSGKHPHKSIPFLLYAYVAESDLEPITAEELAYLNAPDPSGEDAWFDALPKPAHPDTPPPPPAEPVKVLGDFVYLAPTAAIERALRNLRFELAMRKEATDGR
jgi:hypothetical protein